nr:MAG TPA: Double zinc ribbon protein [Caudoviricetes sp.]
MPRHNKTCSRCGTPYDAPNPECITCRRRTNQQRRRRGESKPRPRRTPKPPKTTCHQCGGPLENRTRGCRTCYQRHYYRKQKDGQNNGKNLTSEQLDRDPGLATFIATRRARRNPLHRHRPPTPQSPAPLHSTR